MKKIIVICLGLFIMSQLTACANPSSRSPVTNKDTTPVVTYQNQVIIADSSDTLFEQLQQQNKYVMGESEMLEKILTGNLPFGVHQAKYTHWSDGYGVLTEDKTIELYGHLGDDCRLGPSEICYPELSSDSRIKIRVFYNQSGLTADDFRLEGYEKVSIEPDVYYSTLKEGTATSYYVFLSQQYACYFYFDNEGIDVSSMADLLMTYCLGLIE